MLRKALITFFALILSLVPSASYADEQADFDRYMDGFYFLDDQEFKEITCTVAVDALEKTVAYIRGSVGQQPGVVIVENLADFKLTIDKASGVSFMKPSLSVHIPPDQESSRHERRQTGARMIENGFKTSVDGTVMVLEGLMETFISPEKPGFLLQSFDRDGDAVEYAYERNGQSFTARCEGGRCVRGLLEGGMAAEITETFISYDRKLYLQSYAGVVTDSMSAITTTINVGYTTVSGIAMPSRISGSSQMRSLTTNIDGKVDIVLKDCKVR